MSKVEEIKLRLKKEMNGAVSADMRTRGIVYGLNYGVSLPTIKAIAKDYFPDHELAAELFSDSRDIRELKIAATYIDDPALVTCEQMRSWGAAFSNEEIANLAVMNLFFAADCAGEVALEWISSGDLLLQSAGLRLVGRITVAGRVDGALLQRFVDAVGEIGDFRSVGVALAAVYALCKVGGLVDIEGLLGVVRGKQGGAFVASEVLDLLGD